MRETPIIAMQLIHIHGPLKGRIQEFADAAISLGSQSSCHVPYPPELTGIAANHARIIREGNRFKLIDQSAGNTFVNGKRVQETYLRDGDVIILNEGGPKLSFLTHICATPPPPPVNAAQPAQATLPPAPPDTAPAAEPAQPEPTPPAPPEAGIPKAAAPLSIQYGTLLRSYQELPVTIGSHGGCDFMLAHPALKKEQAVVFFSQDHYWIRDLAGDNAVCLNGQPIGYQSALQAGDTISLAPGGPCLQFLGEGRLAEYETGAPQASGPQSQPVKQPACPQRHSLLKKIFKK